MRSRAPARPGGHASPVSRSRRRAAATGNAGPHPETSAAGSRGGVPYRIVWGPAFPVAAALRKGKHQQDQRDARDGRESLGEAGGEDHHFADEEPERRQANQGQHRREKRDAGARHAAHQSAYGRDLGRAVRGPDAAREEEDDRLGQSVVGDVQQSSGGTQGAPEAEPEAHEADVLDARVGEHAFVIGRRPQECGGDGDG